MSETPINLNKVRKARARAEAKTRANTNAVAFGRSKAEKAAEGQVVSRMRRDLDGKALKSPDDLSGKGSKKP